MRFKIGSITLIAWSITVLVGLFLCAVLYFGKMWQPHWVAIVTVIMIAIYHFVTYSVAMVIDVRVRPLYQFIGSSNKGKLRKDMKKSIAMLEGEMQVWVERSKDEMDTLRMMEHYRKEFLGNVSHELKTPLFSLQGYIDTLRSGGVNDKDVCDKYLERSDRNIERLINIVRDLEEISRLESDTMVLYKSTFDIVTLINEAYDSMETLFAERGVSFGFVSDRAVVVSADRSRVEQVVINLLSNAVKYNQTDGMVNVSINDMFDRVMICVEDSGVGIAAEHLPRLFERFYRIDKGRSRDAGGTGLGLAIVKHIIEAHQQTITVQSTLGQGSLFCFTLSKQ